MANNNRFQYPSNKKVYGIVVQGTTPTQDIETLLGKVKDADGDLVVFLSVAPHDIRQRADWPTIQRNVLTRSENETHEVELIDQSDIAIAAANISVLNG